MSIILTAGDLYPMDRHLLLPYTAVMTNTIRQWRQFLLQNGNRSEWFTKEEVANWLNRAKATVNAMMLRYVFDQIDELYVDLFASGFPHRYNIRILSDEIKQPMDVKKVRQKRLELQRAFLDDLRKRQKANIVFLHEISLTHVHEVLSTTGPMKDFNVVSLRKVIKKPGQTKEQYVCVFERYGHRNLPTLYSLHFEFDGELDNSSASHLAMVLEAETSDLTKLKPLAERIDQSSGKLHPKVLCRIIAGPVFVNRFTLDDNPLQAALNGQESKPLSVSASRIIHECIMSESETTMHSLMDPHGNKMSVLQQFAVRGLDDECQEREVTHVEKYLFAPHRIIQTMDESWRKEINHTVITTDQGERE